MSDTASAGYTLVIPPGWVRIPLRQGTNAALRKILDKSFRHLPRDKVAPYRMEIERRLKEQIAVARRGAGIDLYFAADAADSGPVPASFAVSEARYHLPADAPAGTVLDPAEVLAVLAAGAEGARVVEVDGAPGIRTERVVRPAPSAEFRYATRRTEYTIAVPGDPGRWLIVAFSTPGSASAEGALAKLLTDLFDAIMATFRWIPAPGEPGVPSAGRDAGEKGSRDAGEEERLARASGGGGDGPGR